MGQFQTIKLPDGLGDKDATVRRWAKSAGEAVATGELLVVLETRRALVEVTAPVPGVLAAITAGPGTTVISGAELGRIAPAGAEKKARNVPKNPENAPKSEEKAVKSAAEVTPPAGNVTPLLLPQAGNTMEEGTITRWLVNPGDTITPGQIIYEVETDKATVEVEADAGGRLARIVADVGDIVPVKAPVAFLAETDADVDAYLAGIAPEEPAQAAEPARQTGSLQVAQVVAPKGVEGRVKASPAARRLAAERGIELAGVGAGSGPGGRILSTDLAGVQSAPRRAGTTAGEMIRTPLTKMRRAIGRNLQMSKQQVPHFYVKVTVDADAMMRFYQARKAEFPVSVNDVVTMAVGRALAEFPGLRSRLEGDELVTIPSANVGIAVGADEGLTVPVLVGAEQMNLRTIAAETRRIVTAARNGQLEGVGRGVFTITNLGMFGVEEFSAIINPPESGILAVGAVKEAVIVEGGAMRPGRTVALTLSVDHRVVDGIMAAKFVARLKELLEQPEAME